MSKSEIANRIKKLFDNYITTPSYIDSEIFDKRITQAVVITIKETGGAQSIYYKLLACIDTGDWHEVIGETALLAGQHAAITISDPWAYLKLQAKNNSGSGTVLAFISGQPP